MYFRYCTYHCAQYPTSRKPARHGGTPLPSKSSRAVNTKKILNRTRYNEQLIQQKTATTCHESRRHSHTCTCHMVTGVRFSQRFRSQRQATATRATEARANVRAPNNIAPKGPHWASAQHGGIYNMAREYA
eukprot:scaffold27835_cov122-Isochrysis_galbana.AAC.7